MRRVHRVRHQRLGPLQHLGPAQPVVQPAGGQQIAVEHRITEHLAHHRVGAAGLLVPRWREGDLARLPVAGQRFQNRGLRVIDSHAAGVPRARTGQSPAPFDGAVPRPGHGLSPARHSYGIWTALVRHPHGTCMAPVRHRPGASRCPHRAPAGPARRRWIFPPPGGFSQPGAGNPPPRRRSGTGGTGPPRQCAACRPRSQRGLRRASLLERHPPPRRTADALEEKRWACANGFATGPCTGS